MFEIVLGAFWLAVVLILAGACGGLGFLLGRAGGGGEQFWDGQLVVRLRVEAAEWQEAFLTRDLTAAEAAQATRNGMRLDQERAACERARLRQERDLRAQSSPLAEDNHQAEDCCEFVGD